jgi:cytoskeletal protein CcmA (bactofilin family)
VSTDKLGPAARVRDEETLTVSTIGGDLTITGNVTSKGEINLDGHVKGDIHCVALILGENSSVEGNVAADDVVIRGRLIGSVKALRVMLQSASHVEGNLTYQNSLVVEQGAFFDGKSLPSKNHLPTNQATSENSTASERQSMVTGKRKEKRETAFVRSLPESD